MNYTALDTSALSWLLPELKAGLSSVRADVLKAHDDPTAQSLHSAKAAVHEAAGALQIMDAKGLIQYAQALEGALSFLISHVDEATQDALDMLDEACNALIAYLEEIQISSVFAQPLVLFAYYDDLHSLQGTQRYHAADLYFPPLSARFQLPGAAVPLGEEALKRARRHFEHHLLPVLKDQATQENYSNLKDTLAKVAAAQTNAQTYTFWKCCEGVLETLVAQSSQAQWLDLDVKRWVARVNLQLRRLAEGSPHIAERLYREALYFVAHHLTQTEGEPSSAALSSISEAFKLSHSVPAVLMARPYRRLDEAKLSQAKHTMKSLKVLLDEAVHHQDASDGVTRSSVLFEQRFTQARKELHTLVSCLKDLSLKEASLLADALAVVLTQASEKSPVLTTQMSVQAASTLLLIEHSVAHTGAASLAALKHRTQNLQAYAQGLIELEALGQNEDHAADIDGMVGGQGMDEFGLNEALTREITGLMAGVEKNLDNYFRNPGDASPLSACIAPLAQLESSFGMIDLPAAMRAAQTVQAHVKRFMGQSGADNSHLFAPLAQEFGRLSVLVELFGKNPSHARLHFRYDEREQKLIETPTADLGLDQKELMKGQDSPFESVEALAAQRQNEAQALMQALIARPSDASTKLALEQSLKALKVDAELIGDDALGDHATAQLAKLNAHAFTQTAPPAPVVVKAANANAVAGESMPAQTSGFASVITMPSEASPLVAPKTAAPQAEDDTLSFEQEMLQTFLEEAQEVLSILKPRLQTLKAAPDNHSCLNHVRRAFHTLKGSGRMVNLNALGDASWAIEHRLNDLLARQTPMPSALLDDLNWAHAALCNWVNELQSSGRSDASAQTFIRRFELAPPVSDQASLDAPSTALAADSPAAASVPSVLNVLPGVEQLNIGAAPQLDNWLDSSLASALPPSIPKPVDATNQGADLGQSKPRISLVADNSARLAQDFAPKTSGALGGLGDFAAKSPMAAPAPKPNGITVVGPIKLPAPLYAIYIAESEDHISQLEADLKAWSLQPNQGCSYEAYRFAHSLKGGAATVGFGTLRDIASSLEGVLDLSHKRNVALDEAQFELVVNTVKQLRWMHGEFARGVYPTGDYDLVLALSQLCSRLNAEPPAVPPEQTLTDAPAVAKAADAPVVEPVPALVPTLVPALVAALVPAPLATEIKPAPASITATQPSQSNALASSELDVFASMLGSFARPAAGLPAPVVLMPASIVPDGEFANLHARSSEAESMIQPQLNAVTVSPVVDLQEMRSNKPSLSSGMPAPAAQDDDDAANDPIAAQLALLEDEIEPSILPDFMEEADELMPQCAQWVMALEHGASQAGELRRGLHTLKGGARMAGAMKLGGVLHMLESDVESLLLSTASQQLTQTAHLRIVDLFDRAQHLYDVLTGRAAPQAFKNRSDVDVPSQLESAQLLEAAPNPLNEALSVTLDSALGQALSQPATVGRDNASPAPAAAPSAARSVSAPINTPALQTPPLSASKLSLVASTGNPQAAAPAATTTALASLPAIRLRTDTLDRLVNQAGEVTSNRARLDQHVVQLRGSLKDLTDNVERIRSQLREVEIQAESQMNTRLEQTRVSESQFDPLEFDRFTRFQELTRMLAESLSDMVSMRDSVATTLTLAERDLSEQSKLTRDLTQSLMRTRLVQFDAVSDRLYRVARQAAKDLGKQVELDIQGGTVELDRSILERMTAPLEHLVRNCLAHGIELPAQRLAAGKAALGHIVVATRQVGNEIELTVQDDGAGLDLNKIRLQAIAKGLLAPDAMPGHAQLAELVFLPGFSTASEITQVSGRGVGMDVVRSEAAALGGRVNIEMLGLENGKAGSKFVIRLPLTLAVNQVLLVRAANAVFAVPAALIESLTSVPLEQLGSAYQTQRLEQRGYHYPFAYLGSLLELAQTPASSTQRTAQVLLIHSGNERVAVHIDAVLGNQEVVVKNIGSMLSRIQGINSATVLGAGELCLIIDPGQLWLRQSTLHNAFAAVGQTAITPQETRPLAAVPALPVESQARKLAMVVDDSLTVRKVTQRLLAREGWQVVLAKDGVDALEQLQSLVPDVMLVDIEMPRMDGFDLTRNVRADERLVQVPIIMITSRMADKHKQYAKELGVNAYLGKPYHDDELLENMMRLTQLV